MSKRLQVLLEQKEYKTFQQMAREAGLSLGEWVRKALRKIASDQPRKTPEEKIAAIRRLSKMNLAPSGDIEQMLAEIEKGYLES